MAIQIQLSLLLQIVLLIRRNDCEGIGTTSTTLPPTTRTTTTTASRPYPGCGQNLDFEIGGTIVGGMEIEKNAYPWMAFLYNYNRNQLGMEVMELNLPQACKPTKITTTTTTTTTTTPASSQTTNVSVKEADANLKISDTICLGSLIHPRFILTAAHCVACRRIDNTAVVLGKNKLKTNMDLMYLADILVYPEYVRGVDVDFRNNPDIALLKLEKAVQVGPKLNVICLPTDPRRLYEEVTLLTSYNTEWGVTYHLKSSDKLTAANVTVISNMRCSIRNGYDFLKGYLGTNDLIT